jgi:diguanylate cyclase
MSDGRQIGSSDWKNKYFATLEAQEKKERQLQQRMALLIQAVLRISFVAEGVDQQLDKQLKGLRHMFREGSPSSRDLNLVVEALAGQVKRLDAVKVERAKAITSAFQSLVSQLQTLKPEKEAKQQLQQLNKSLKLRSSQIQHYSALVNDYAKVQREVLSERNIKRVSKPFWHHWVDRSTQEPIEKAALAAQHPEQDASPEKYKFTAMMPDQAPAAVLDLANDKEAPVVPIDPASVGEEPPFSRLNQAICEVLSDLLAQIEPPPMAKQNYQTAQQRIDKGLNWYELVPTLEEISIVVVSAFDSHQKDFEHFLSQLNDRLAEAYQFISASRRSHDEGIEAGQQLNTSMREQVSAIQQSVAAATEMEQLKSEVSGRLDQILAAMDRHQAGEQQRELSLSEQLDALVERVKNMETTSAEAEQKIEEQRQKALRDVLTQLPNREAYQQRLEQEFERWQRYNRPLVMVVCDIDHFKRINDSYGHLAGDKVLRIIAKTLQKRLRKTDFIARFGGEEFVILMPETEQQQALTVAEGVREAIARCPFHFKEKPVSITMSFGISAFAEGDQAEQVFARADKALYKAKEKGRNQCVLSENKTNT